MAGGGFADVAILGTTTIFFGTLIWVPNLLRCAIHQISLERQDA